MSSHTDGIRMEALTWVWQTSRRVSVEMEVEVSSSAREEQDCRLMVRKRKGLSSTTNAAVVESADL